MRNGFAICSGLLLALAGSALGQQSYDSPQSAAQALIDAAGKHDSAQLGVIFGPRGNGILTSGNAGQDRAEQEEFSRLAQTKHQILPDGRDGNRVILSIGDDDWPFPAPIVKTNGKWSFDADAAGLEMAARRIGSNELSAIEVCVGYVAAQQKYASEARDKDGMLEYASHLVNTEGGLFRQDDPDMPEGLADALWDGQKHGTKAFHGYFFRILDGQGPSARGGAHSYLVKGRLMGGFGLVAWPARYGASGIQTFIVNQEGVVYQKDIAPAANSVATPITRYDPDPSWRPVE